MNEFDNYHKKTRLKVVSPIYEKSSADLDMQLKHCDGE